MATAGVMNGSLMQVKFIDAFSGTPSAVIGLQTECSISLSMDTRDITTKASSAWRQLLGGTRSGSLTFSALHSMDSANGLAELMGSFNDGSLQGQCTVLFSTGVTGDDQYQADAILTSLELSAGTEDNTTMSGTFEFAGAVTFAQTA